MIFSSIGFKLRLEAVLPIAKFDYMFRTYSIGKFQNFPVSSLSTLVFSDTRYISSTHTNAYHLDKYQGTDLSVPMVYVFDASG